jgi:hypothetical protein
MMAVSPDASVLVATIVTVACIYAAWWALRRGRAAPARSATEDNLLLVCSFCGKNQDEVRKLIAGPKVYICDECIDLCNDIIVEECDREEPADGSRSAGSSEGPLAIRHWLAAGVLATLLLVAYVMPSAVRARALAWPIALVLLVGRGGLTGRQHALWLLLAIGGTLALCSLP